MVDEVVTKQELIDAQKDAQSLDDFINGGDEQIVVTRLLKEYPTLANAIRQIYEKGGKFYPTLADANADIENIRTDVYVITGDNGAYYKATAEATTLTKSPYDPLTQAKNYSDVKVSLNSSENILEIRDLYEKLIVMMRGNGDLYIPNLDKSVQKAIKDIVLDVADIGTRVVYDDASSLFKIYDSNNKLIVSITNRGALIINDVVTKGGSVDNRLSNLESNAVSDTNTEILKATDRAIAARDDEALLNNELIFSLEELSSRYVFASSITRLSKKEFLVFCEARMGGDFGETKIFMRKVTVNNDYSLTLGVVSIVADSGGVDVGAFSCINSCSLKVETGAHAGRIYLYYIKRFYNDDRDETYQIYSDDDGVTWSTPIDMSVFIPNFANWRIVAIGPGKAIQLKKGTYAGRIILPCWHGDLNYPASQAGLKSFILYSDDGGETYTVGAESIYAGSNECQVAELADGGFALLTRDASEMKAIEYSFDGGLTLVDARKLSEITTTMVQSGFLQPQNKYDLSVPKLVVSTPSKGGVREDIGLWVSYDEKTFNLWKILATGMASYSDLMPIDESHILITYSAGRADQNRDIKAVVVNLKSILLEQ